MNNLKAIRKEKKIKQVDVAKYLNITNATYSRYETGSLEPSNDTLRKLAKYFDVSVDYLLGYVENNGFNGERPNKKAIQIPAEVPMAEMSILKKLRRNAKRSQASIASELRITRQMYAKYESGISVIPPTALKILSRIYGVSIDYILGNDKENHNTLKIGSRSERIRKKIRIARRAAGLNQESAATALGIKRPTLTRYESGSLKVSGEMLASMADVYGVSMDFFNDKGFRIPILRRIPAGIPFEAITDIEGWEEIDPERSKEGLFYCLRIEGRSMEPTIMDGSLVVCRVQNEVPNGKVAIVSINGDDATCKRVQLNPDGITLIGDNPSVYPPHFYSAKEVEELPVRIIAQVIETKRNLE